jgi:hypothetical protein
LWCQPNDEYDRVVGRIAHLTQVDRVSKDGEVIPDPSKALVLLIIQFSVLDELSTDDFIFTGFVSRTAALRALSVVLMTGVGVVKNPRTCLAA